LWIYERNMHNTPVTRRPSARRCGPAGWNYYLALIDGKLGMRKGMYTGKAFTDVRLCNFQIIRCLKIEPVLR